MPVRSFAKANLSARQKLQNIDKVLTIDIFIRPSLCARLLVSKKECHFGQSMPEDDLHNEGQSGAVLPSV